MRAILDTNVVVDVLQRREPWFQDGAVIFRAIANKQVTGCLTAKQIADLHFFSRKQFKGEENVDARARQVVGKILSLFELIDTLGIDCQNALGINNGDYEDAILIESAARAGVEYIVTRNPAHYKTSSVQVYSPAEFVRFISRQD
ncbi:MAG: PIN domain-containing protein [Clostridia bacterium]|jgi:predicted nucleic acid-binding protein|nr:PIN domain-containing protein [Clostridia bacterium]MBQ4434734.1 PIN domain-containing protein [Clostridia bacterium]MBR2797463.1 PIN domain-containing protein [Clostridia bacterium]MBR2799240.1 PIN domain-containing protein [Clostridia bacterium]MBR3274322.1 PIN domain-containing protein [Clostridia bacterium]